MATIFAAFGKSLGNNKGSVQNFGIVGVTIATEELSKFIFFFCPCEYPVNQVYGSIFIWGPGAVLLVVGYLANRRTWRLTTGLCNRTQTVGRGGKRIFHFIFIFLSIGCKAMIAPATWVVLAFLKGDYYACARWPDPTDTVNARIRHSLKPSNDSLPRPCLFRDPNPLKFRGDSEADVIARNLRAESHIIGWFYLTIGMLFGVLVMFCMRCRSKYSYEQGNYIERYRQNEIKLFEDELDKKAEEQAKRIVDGYFSKTRAKEDWDKIAVINDKVTRSKRGRAIYSPLHKFVNKELRNAEDSEKIDDLVADAAKKTKRLWPSKKPKPTNGAGSGGPTGGGPAIAMTTMVVTGKSSKPLLRAQPPESKPSVFADPPVTKPGDSTKPAPTTTVQVEDETAHASGSNLVVVDPTKPPSIPPHDAVVAPAQPTVTISTPSASTAITQPKITPPVQMEKSTPARPPVTTPVQAEGTAPAPQNVSGTTPEGSAQPAEVAPAIAPPPIPQRPLSTNLTSKNEVEPTHPTVVKETSLGDFGGAVSREDLAVIESSGESNDETSNEPGTIVFEGQELPSDEEVDGVVTQQNDEGYEPLLDNMDEMPLLSED